MGAKKKTVISTSKQEEIDEVVEMFEDDEYDNFKDVILDCRGLLKGLPKEETIQRTRLEKVLIKATTEAQELADEDPEMAEYLEGLIDPAYLSPKYKKKKS